MTHTLGASLLALLLFALLMTTQTPNTAAQTSRDFAEAHREFRTFYAQSLRKHGIVGNSFMLLHDNQVVAQEFYGLADQETRQPVDENTIYHWASITKTFTAIAIMQLRDRGQLKLDDPIVQYLPELRQVHNRFGAMEKITIKHLMTHSAGFRAATWPWGGDKEWEPHEPKRWEQLVAMMPYTEIEFEPGSRFSYSNPGIIFLGRVIEQLSGDDYEVYIDKNIFKPLEMYLSYFDATPYHLLKHRSHSYYLRDGKTTPARFDADTGITVSNGGLNAPLTDMVRYLSFLLGDARRQAIYDGVLKRSSLQEMWEPQVQMESPKDGQNRKDAMGLSFFIEDNFNQHFIGHSGTQNGFLSHFYLRPDTRTAYIVAYNTHAIPPEKPINKSAEGSAAQDTRKLDAEIKNYLFQRIFPIFAKP